MESETQTPGGAQSQTVNVNHDCCDSSITEGSDELMGNHNKRGAALEEFSADQSLYDSSTLSYGSMNKLSGPWLSALDDTQASQTMSFFHDPLEDQHRYWINLEKGNIDFLLDERTGRIRATVYDPNTGSDVVLSGSAYDPFGRRTTSTEYSSGTPSGTQYYQNDWLSGDIRAQRTTDIDGSVEHYFNHAPGWSRRMYNTGSGYSESWLIRGPLGQVSYRNDDSGSITGNYQYGSWGNRLPGSTQTGSNPEYYDDNPVHVSDFEHMTTGSAGTRDMSPMMPSADGNMPSGSGGWGTSGNPDVPGGGDTSELNNPSNMYGSWRDRFRNITGPLDAYGGGPGWSWHRPEWDYAGPMATGGTGQGKQPPQAPPAVNDRSTEADRRLADLNNGTGGVNPNGQTGSSMYDDMRNMRAPIGNITLAQDPTGGPQIGDGIVTGGMVAAAAYVGWTGSYADQVLFRQILRKIMDPSAPDPTGVSVGYINVNAYGQWTKFQIANSRPHPGTFIGGLLDGVRNNVSGVSAWIRGVTRKAGNAVKGAWDTVTSTATSVWNTLSRGYVKAATWLQNKIDYAGESWFGEIPWHKWKGQVKDLWDNPWFQGALVAASFVTPWPGDEEIGLLWGLGKLEKSGYTLFKFLEKIPGFDRHHLIEKRLAHILDVKPGEIPGVHLPKDVHNEITQLWRKYLPYKNSGKPINTNTATIDDVINAAREVYRDFPEYWRQTERWLRDIGKLQ